MKYACFAVDVPVRSGTQMNLIQIQPVLLKKVVIGIMHYFLLNALLCLSYSRWCNKEITCMQIHFFIQKNQLLRLVFIMNSVICSFEDSKCNYLGGYVRNDYTLASGICDINTHNLLRLMFVKLNEIKEPTI